MIEVPWQVPLPSSRPLRKTVVAVVWPVTGFVTIAMPVVLLWLNHWWIGDGVVRNCSWDRRLFHRKVLLDLNPPRPRRENLACVPWSGMQNRRNCNSITPTCTDTSYRVYLMNIEKSFRFLLSLSRTLRLINVKLWNDGTLFNALWTYMQHMTHEKSFHRSNVPRTRTCVYVHTITRYRLWLK